MNNNISNNMNNMSTAMKVTMAKNIKRLMYENDVSAIDVCKAIDVPESTFSYWLNARSYPRIDKIERMANYFGVRKSDLVEEYNNWIKEKPAVEEYGRLSEEDVKLLRLFHELTDEEQAMVLDVVTAALRRHI